MTFKTPFLTALVLSTSAVVVACGGAVDGSNSFMEDSAQLAEELELSSRGDTAELECKSSGGTTTCTSDYYWVCPDGWSACSQEGAKTCCEKKTSSVEFDPATTDLVAAGGAGGAEEPLDLVGRDDESELECTSGGGKITCTSDYYWVCPDGWSACSQAGAKTCCEKSTSSEPPPDEGLDYVSR